MTRSATGRSSPGGVDMAARSRKRSTAPLMRPILRADRRLVPERPVLVESGSAGRAGQRRLGVLLRPCFRVVEGDLGAAAWTSDRAAHAADVPRLPGRKLLVRPIDVHDERSVADDREHDLLHLVARVDVTVDEAGGNMEEPSLLDLGRLAPAGAEL